MVNFTNILRAAFCTKVFPTAFWYLNFRFALFWRKKIIAKAALKMLVKLTPIRSYEKNENFPSEFNFNSLPIDVQRLSEFNRTDGSR